MGARCRCCCHQVCGKPLNPSPAIAPAGIIFVKENICGDGFVVDKDDNSLTRSNAYMLELFERANMRVMYNVKQKNFPKELYEVRMYVLRPR